MKRTNQNEKKRVNPKIGLFHMILGMFAANGLDQGAAYRRSFHQVFLEGCNPIYITRKHTVMNYAKQNRLARKRRKVK
jgi:hypothetical protein